MPNLRDACITFIEDVIEAENLHSDLLDRAEVLLELLEDQRDDYGSRPWDED